jgi:hypothetical protein
MTGVARSMLLEQSRVGPRYVFDETTRREEISWLMVLLTLVVEYNSHDLASSQLSMPFFFSFKPADSAGAKENVTASPVHHDKNPLKPPVTTVVERGGSRKRSIDCGLTVD